jgi:hypothetical protein
MTDDLRARLVAALPVAMKQRDRAAVTALRSAPVPLRSSGCT